MRNQVACLLTIVLCLMSAGCPTAAPPNGGNDNTDNNTNDNGMDGGSNLPEEQAAAIDAAFDAAIALGTIGSGAFPSADVRAFIDSFGATPPACPTVDYDADGEIRSVTLDYADSCNPRLYPDATLGGSIMGTVDLNAATASLTFSDFFADDQTIDGTLSASVNRDAPLSTLAAIVNLTVSDLGEISGDALITVDTDNGAITITEATIDATTDSGDDITIDFEMLVIQPVQNGNFFPEGGTATFVLDSGDAAAVQIVIEFDENTPVDGSVTYMIGPVEE